MSYRRPVLAYHVIFGAYGFWLPNDPRGSWSTYVGSSALHQFGSATKTVARRSVARANHDHDVRLAAKRSLKYPAVQFSGIQARLLRSDSARPLRRANMLCMPARSCPTMHISLSAASSALCDKLPDI